MTERTANWKGMNWIRREKRLALYLRDGLACVYCGASVEDEVRLTLDHLVPVSAGGENSASNLVTCCFHCNSARGARDWREFALHVAVYLNHGITGEQIMTHIEHTARRPLDLAAAKALIEQRGGFTQALRS